MGNNNKIWHTSPSVEDYDYYFMDTKKFEVSFFLEFSLEADSKKWVQLAVLLVIFSSVLASNVCLLCAGHIASAFHLVSVLVEWYSYFLVRTLRL